MMLLAGVDGCPDGWVVAFAKADFRSVEIVVVPHFSAIIARGPAVTAVDIPIGLPQVSGFADRAGRAAEFEARALLVQRRASVFSTPSRAAAYAEISGLAGNEARRIAHGRASEIARRTSEPSRGMSIQTFSILPKIREVDACLRAGASVAGCVFEAHPEVAFLRMNGNAALTEPKKTKGRPNGPGLTQRRALLIAAGLPTEDVHAKAPRGAGEDDLVDALACLVVARRIHQSSAMPLPNPPPRDAHGLPMAIWA